MEALPMEMRLRVIEDLDEGLSVLEIAERRGIGTTTVQTIRHRWRQGIVGPLPHGGGQTPVIDLAGRELLRRLVWQQPDRSWDELTALYNELRGTSVGRSSVQRHVADLGFTRKKSPRTVRSSTGPT
jgi:transposase